MQVTEILLYTIVGFVPSIVAMELAWRMGNVIGKRNGKILSKLEHSSVLS